jgi:hypothetical protein
MHAADFATPRKSPAELVIAAAGFIAGIAALATGATI